MGKSLARDNVHSTILTSLQKPRVPDCSPSGSVTLNFWTMLPAFNLLHVHMVQEGKRHTWDQITDWKQKGWGSVQCLFSLQYKTHKMSARSCLPFSPGSKAYSRDVLKYVTYHGLSPQRGTAHASAPYGFHSFTMRKAYLNCCHVYAPFNHWNCGFVIKICVSPLFQQALNKCQHCRECFI